MTRVLLKFSEKLVEQPITAQIILEHQVPVNIVSSHVDSQGGTILADLPSECSEKLVKAFREKGVTVTIPELIEVAAEKCFNCGACLSLCPVNAITMGEDSSVMFNKEKCIGKTCEICVDACPVRAIKLSGQGNKRSTKPSK